MIRVLVVDDSRVVRRAVSQRLRAAGLEVVGEASDGREAVALTHRLRPDVVLMDVVMPGVDGLAATRQIMAECPTPVVILTAHADHQEVFKTCDAVAVGALEVCAKPTGTESPESQAEWDRILLTIGAAAQVPVMRLRSRATAPKTGPSGKVKKEGRSLLPERPEGCFAHKGPAPFFRGGIPDVDPRIVVMGASTGGPAAVKYVLSNLPSDFPIPILVAIHCSHRIVSSIGSWIDRQCSLDVHDAQDGETLPNLPGTVISAPPGHNLRISGNRLRLQVAESGSGCSPSIDELFESAADRFGEATIGVLLTGMGADGARGLRRIHDCGGYTITQDEATSAVFGMPAAAINLGAVSRIAPLHRLPQSLIQLVRPSAKACEPIGTCP